MSTPSLSLPATQKALLQPSPTSTHLILDLNHPVPQPSPTNSEHLIRVHTVAITNGELLWRKNFPPTLPHNHPPIQPVPGYDVAGTVLIAPPDSPFPPGTEVYARSDYKRTACAREYTILLTCEMARRPAGGMSWAECATVPMSAETAWQALFVHGGLEAREGGNRGKRVFVNAASGGVGGACVQLAKWAGAHVVASCGKSNVDWVRGLGADEVLDRSADVGTWLAGGGEHVDLAIDCIGRKPLEDCWRVARPDGGLVVSVFAPPDEAKKPEGVRSLFFIMESDGQQLGRVTELIERGGWKAGLDSVFEFGDFEKAFEKVAGGGTRGKVVLDLGV